MKSISILGSTGSIGKQTIEVIRQHPEKFKVVGIAGKDEVEVLQKQVEEFKPAVVSVAGEETAEKLQKLVSGTDVVSGKKGLEAVATIGEADTVVGALVGFLGFEPTLKAIEAGKNIALANKETLVAGGHIIMQEVEKHNVELTPIDSEHCALFQCLKSGDHKEVKKLIVTCSGGAFKFKKKAGLENVTPEQALGHPTWSMGAKITIDSATLFNKGLEVIEAHWLFDMPYEKIETVMHPQSIVHSLVEFVDGSLVGQLGTHDMRIPIQYALSYPERFGNGFPTLDLVEASKLEFFDIDTETFRGLPLAIEAGKTGGTMPAVMNAANEEAVYAFLDKKLGFLAIAEVVEKVMEKHKPVIKPSFEEVLEADKNARAEAKKAMAGDKDD